MISAQPAYAPVAPGPEFVVLLLGFLAAGIAAPTYVGYRIASGVREEFGPIGVGVGVAVSLLLLLAGVELFFASIPVFVLLAIVAALAGDSPTETAE